MDQEEIIKERVSNVLVDVIQRNELSNVKLSKILNCNRNTINNHRLKAHVPRLTLITKLALKFNVNLNWLYYGVGPMYLGDEPDSPGSPYHAKRQGSGSHLDPRDSAQGAAESSDASEKALAAQKSMVFGEALDRAAKILCSKTPYANRLLANIEYLDYAVQNDENREKIAKNMMALHDEVASMSKSVAKMKPGSSKSKRATKKSPVKKKGAVGKKSAVKKKSPVRRVKKKG